MKALDRKLATILAGGYTHDDFIIADAKDADMAFGVAAAGMAPGQTPLEVELGLERVIPAEFMLHAHHWLILHGRYTCLARNPRCELCVINDLCRWPEKTV